MQVSNLYRKKKFYEEGNVSQTSRKIVCKKTSTVMQITVSGLAIFHNTFLLPVLNKTTPQYKKILFGNCISYSQEALIIMLMSQSRESTITLDLPLCTFNSVENMNLETFELLHIPTPYVAMMLPKTNICSKCQLV